MADPKDDWYLSSEVRLPAAVAYIVLLIAGLIGNAIVMSKTRFDVHAARINTSVIAIGLPCFANLVIGTLALLWFACVGVAGSEYLGHLKSACGVVFAYLVLTGVLYLAGID